MSPMRRTACALLSATALAACGGSGDDVPDLDAPMGDPDVQIGVFEVELTAPSGPTAGSTTVAGTIYDADQPEAVIWERSAESAGCELLIPRVPFCATPCGSSAVCVENDTCQPYATKQSVGAVRVTGIATTGGGADFTMEPVNNNYQGVGIAYPPFAAGDAVRFAAAGSAWNGPFVNDAVGVAPFSLTSPDPDLQRDAAIELTWAAGPEPSAVIAVKLDISHHGGTRGKIECRTTDDGALSIAGPLVTGLLDLGAAGFPTIIVERTITGSTVIGAGRVDLELRSQVERPVTVPGVESCKGDGDCTPPETCRDDLTCG